MPATGGELKRVMESEKEGGSFVLFRDDAGRLDIVHLGDGDRLSIGRDASNEIALTWDPEVSRLHARLSNLGVEWVVEDDGLSRNGTFLNGERLAGSARLRDHDVLRLGRVVVGYRCVRQGSLSETLTGLEGQPPEISAAEARVLRELARPWIEGRGLAATASNGEIAEQLTVSIHTVKSHLRTLIAKFGLDELPQSRKRAALVEAAFRTGAIARR